MTFQIAYLHLLTPLQERLAQIDHYELLLKA